MAILVDNKQQSYDPGDHRWSWKISHRKNAGIRHQYRIGGATPGKGGQEIHGKPVFDTVKECVEIYWRRCFRDFPAGASFVKEAAIEAIRAGIKFLVVIPEHIPIHDMLHVRREAVARGVTVIGGNTAGIITPGVANLGIMPDIAFKPGRVGTISRSGSITYYVADTLTQQRLR